MDMENKVVWITGASSGIGEALAVEMGRRGAALVLSSRRRDRLIEVGGKCGIADEKLFLLPLDLADIDSLPEKANMAETAFGRIDILINNAGVSQRSKVSETEITVIKKIIDVNFLSGVVLTKEVLTGMLARRAGHIVAVSSIVAKFSTPLRAAYCASKHALHGFYNALRAEVKEGGVDVTLIVPAFVKTGISVNALLGDGSAYGAMDKNQERGISPGECARKILHSIEKKKREVYVGMDFKARTALFVSSFSPVLFERIITRARIT